MKRWQSITAQILAGVAQVVNILAPVLSERNKLYVAGGLAAGQVLVNAVAHNTNPDGTPAEVAWEKKTQ